MNRVEIGPAELSSDMAVATSRTRRRWILSRDDREGAGFIYTLEAAGVAVYEYTTKQAVDVSNPMTRTMLNMKFGFAAQESEAASARTTEQKVQRMNAGRLNDGRVLGYKTTGEAKKRVRVIDQDEAKLVRRIFRMAADGKGILKIAKELNGAGITNPTGQFRTFTDFSGNLDCR